MNKIQIGRGAANLNSPAPAEQLLVAVRTESVISLAIRSRVLAQIERVASSEARVFSLGETWTGEELVARMLRERRYLYTQCQHLGIDLRFLRKEE